MREGVVARKGSERRQQGKCVCLLGCVVTGSLTNEGGCSRKVPKLEQRITAFFFLLNINSS